MAGSGIAFDVGAFRGDKTKALLLEGYTSIVSFEPNPVYANKIRSRFKSRVTVVQEAVGSYEGIAKLMICTKAPAISTCNEQWKTGRFKKYKWDNYLVVDQTTLDNAILRFGMPTFIKIDVEGYESEVLKGLNTCVPSLSFEFANEFRDSIEENLKLLKQIGYKKFSLKYGKSPDYACKWSSAKTILRNIDKSCKCSWGDIYAKGMESRLG